MRAYRFAVSALMRCTGACGSRQDLVQPRAGVAPERHQCPDVLQHPGTRRMHFGSGKNDGKDHHRTRKAPPRKRVSHWYPVSAAPPLGYRRGSPVTLLAVVLSGPRRHPGAFLSSAKRLTTLDSRLRGNDATRFLPAEQTSNRTSAPPHQLPDEARRAGREGAGAPLRCAASVGCSPVITRTSSAMQRSMRA
jgi:hypothetical protein